MNDALCLWGHKPNNSLMTPSRLFVKWMHLSLSILFVLLWILILSSSTIDNKLRIYTKLENKLEIYKKNLEICQWEMKSLKGQQFNIELFASPHSTVMT